MKITERVIVLGLLMWCLIGVAILRWESWRNPDPQATRIESRSSVEFKKQARETVDAIERMHFYSGAMVDFEARKALDTLSRMADTPGEWNSVTVLSSYFYAVQKLHRFPESEKVVAEYRKAATDKTSILIGDY